VRKKYFLICLFVLFSLYTHVLKAQKKNSGLDRIKSNGRIWDDAFNTKDTVTYFNMVDSAISITSVGGAAIGLLKFKMITSKLFGKRPDISMVFKPEKVEISEQMEIGYDTGTWAEVWTENGDTSKSEIRGKYWRMWKKQNSDWKILAVTLTPLSCKGSYCDK
jgi:ketosteroid isomerase-like protein